MSSQPSSCGKVIVLNGFPGAGKYTILEHVQKLLPANKTCLFDNHLLIDPVQAVYPDRGPEHHELRRTIRKPAFEALGKLAQEGHVVLMTACLADDNDMDAACFQEHLDMVRGTDVPLFWINVYCDQAALEQRVGSSERCQTSKTKLTDVSVLQMLVREHRLLEPHDTGDGLVMLVVKSLDVSGSVVSTVDRLMDMIGLEQSVESV